MKTNTSWKLTSMIAVATIATMIGGMRINAASYNWNPTTTTNVDGEDVYLWSTADNWLDGSSNPGVPPGNNVILINNTGSTRAVLNSDAGSQYLYVGDDAGGTTDGELAIYDGGSITVDRNFYNKIGDGGYTGTVNQYGGTFACHSDTDLRLGDSATSTGIYNLYDGTLSMSVRGLIEVGQVGTGEFHVTGGTIDNVAGIDLGTGVSGLFEVGGSAATIRTGRWNQGANGTLKVGVDGTGLSLIEVTGDVTFDADSLLDVGFLAGAPNYGTWDVMSWTGTLTDGGLDFVGTVDTDVWSFSFVDTDTSGSFDTLRITAIPEPSSLVLLGLAGLLLMKRRW